MAVGPSSFWTTARHRYRRIDMNALLLAATIMMGSSWGPGQCVSVEAPRQVGDHWITRQDDPGRIYLYRGVTQIGGYDTVLDYYRPYDSSTDTWGDKCPSPTPPPVSREPSEPRGSANYVFGVDSSKLSGIE